MSVLRPLLAWFSGWIDDAAVGFSHMGEFSRRGRQIQLFEQTDGGFAPTRTDKRGHRTSISPPLRIEGDKFIGPTPNKTRSILTGSRIELVLTPSRFIFRELELPLRAAEFLEGVVREQIDRLTPWRSTDAAFGWGAPVSLDDKRILVTVAATTRTSIAPLAQAVAHDRANSLIVSTSAELAGDGGARICVFSQRGGSHLRLRRWRFMLIGALGLSSITTVVAAAAVLLVGSRLNSQLASLQHEIAAKRAAFAGGRGSEAERALAALDEKKRAAPPDVIVLEALSKTLPDSAYLTELRIEDGKLQIAGLAEDTPGLIRLIEQSPHFTRARFTAATTIAPAERGERFHIEAHVEPIVAVTP